MTNNVDISALRATEGYSDPRVPDPEVARRHLRATGARVHRSSVRRYRRADGITPDPDMIAATRLAAAARSRNLPVVAMNAGQVTGCYLSMTVAARAAGVTRAAVSFAVANPRRVCAGRRWRLATPSEITRCISQEAGT